LFSAQVTQEINEIESLLLRKPCDDANSTRPPALLDLTTGREEQLQSVEHPLFDHLLRIDDVSGLEGAATSPSQFTPADFLRIPDKVIFTLVLIFKILAWLTCWFFL
jgi:hypothetical protein